MNIQFVKESNIKELKNTILVLGLTIESLNLPNNIHIQGINREILNNLFNTLVSDNLFSGSEGDILSTILISESEENVKLLLYGLGPSSRKITQLDLEELGGKFSVINFIKNKDIYIKMPELLYNGNINESKAISYIANGFRLKSWNFSKYKNFNNHEVNRREEIKVFFESTDPEQSILLFDKLSKITNSVIHSRSLVSEPGNILTTYKLTEEAEKLTNLDLKVKVLDETDLLKLGLNAILSVGDGSKYKPRLVILKWNGYDDSEDYQLALVGKGITFDSGGISIKPSNRMDEMKGDMAGASVVLGVLEALAKKKSKVNVVGILPIAENMPSDKAQRPGDIIKSVSGKTIEVLNTDAEGRLILADALWFAQKEYNPKIIIDIATLTGAIVIALGHEYAGLFSNNKDLSKQLINSGIDVGEKLWELPLDPIYDKDIESDIADVKNVGSNRGAGSITAASFLKKFIENNRIWAHIDIAGTSWDSRERPLSKKGATGFGVRLLINYIEKNHES